MTEPPGSPRGVIPTLGRRLAVLVAAALLGACTAEQVRDTAARTGLGIVRGTCHAGGDCGVSCPEGSTLNDSTLACMPAPP